MNVEKKLFSISMFQDFFSKFKSTLRCFRTSKTFKGSTQISFRLSVIVNTLKNVFFFGGWVFKKEIVLFSASNLVVSANTALGSVGKGIKYFDLTLVRVFEIVEDIG